MRAGPGFPVARVREDFAGRLRARVLDRTNAVVPPVIAIFCIARSHGLVAHIPYWLIVTLPLGGTVGNSLAAAAWAGACRGWRLLARIGVETGTIALVIYGMGWGPLLSIGFVFGTVDVMRDCGSAVTWPAMAWTTLWVGLGQMAIAMRLAPSLVSPPLIHELGFLCLGGTLVVIKALQWFARLKEASEERLRALVANAEDVIAVVSFDCQLSYVSPAFERLLGHRIAELGPEAPAELLHPDDLARLREMTAGWDVRPGQLARTEVRLRRSDGAWRLFEATITNHLAGSAIEGLVVNLHDITEQRKADEALREAHERFRSAFVHAPIGMVITDLEGRILWANAAYGQIVGRKAEDLSGSSVHEFSHPEDRDSVVSEMSRLVSGHSDGYQAEKRYLTSRGHELWVSVSISCVKDAHGEPLYLIIQAEDVTERHMFRERLAHAAIHDPLTGLPNRILFMDRLERALSRARRQARRVAVIFLDLDNFKLVNDSMGHQAGDDLLVAVAGRLKAAVRSSDTLARLGGDEFAVICEEVFGQQAAMGAAQRLVEALGEAFTLEGKEVFLTASMGLAVSGRLGDSASSLLRDADTAMYMAKQRGRARIEVFDHRRHEQAVDRMQLSSELHHALARQQLKLFYQPIAELPAGRLAGMEALLRWVHPTRGLLHPGEFLRMAEDSGLIVPVGEWVIEEACRQFVAWEAERIRRGSPLLPLGMAVNISPRQLASTDLVERVGSILEETGMDPASLWVEIIEGALVDDVDATLGILRSLSGLGVRLSIDDFGSGYSSLGYLRSFPVQAVKIDRSFIEGVAGGKGEDSIVQSVLTLAHSLGLTCIAEGVEEQRQLDGLAALGCRFVQGFLLGVPLPAEILGDSLADDLSSWAVDPMVALSAVKTA